MITRLAEQRHHEYANPDRGWNLSRVRKDFLHTKSCHDPAERQCLSLVPGAMPSFGQPSFSEDLYEGKSFSILFAAKKYEPPRLERVDKFALTANRRKYLNRIPNQIPESQTRCIFRLPCTNQFPSSEGSGVGFPKQNIRSVSNKAVGENTQQRR